MMSILTHPFQVLLMAMIVGRLVRLAFSGGGNLGSSITTLEHRPAA
jgi:hypothetical protein